jgi:Ca-activated chloride channel family protein
MSFGDPLVLLGLLAIPVLVHWYAGQERGRARAAEAFAAPAMRPSVAPESPRWRRHAPLLAFALAISVLIAAAARPARAVTQPVTDGAVMLADDISSSMNATDVLPSREGAARHAADSFIADVPGTVQVGLLEFARRPTVLQSPTGDHALTRSALAQQVHTSGGTAVGVAITAAINELRSVPKVAGKRPPGAIVLISDGASNVGVSPLVIARQAASLHIPIYTISIGTANGTIAITRGHRTTITPVPVERDQLSEIARLAGGRAFRAADAAGVSAAYRNLEAKLGRRTVKQEITAGFAGVGLALLLVGSVLSLRWFGRLA